MLYLRDRWIWDSWPIDDGDDHHLFYLQAPRHIGDPHLRHWQATVGHAVSTDYEHWTVLPDALGPTEAPAWDDLAIWTGSVVRGDAGSWHLFYTAISSREGGRIQRIGRADSDDLITWRRYGDRPLLEADPRWYETLELMSWREVAWRDPWVLRDPSGDGWHMLLTARVRYGPRLTRGVIGHARSADLVRWVVQPPLTRPSGFGQMEVPQVSYLEGKAVLTFCCLAKDITEQRRRITPKVGMWSAGGGSLLGPFDVDGAAPFDDTSIYAAHLVGLDTDRPAMLGFRYEEDGVFVGAIPAPIPVRLTPSGTVAELPLA